MADRGLVLSGFNVIVRDMAASRAFYEKLGVRFKNIEDEWSADHISADRPDNVDLDLDSTEVAHKWDEGWPGAGRSGFGVRGFWVATRADVEELYADMVDGGYASQRPPYAAFWGARY